MNLSKIHIYKVYTALSLLLLIRHSQYYIFHNVQTEYGYLQPIWGVALIPITTMFGAAFCIGREKLITNKSDYLRVLYVLAIPFLLSYVYGNQVYDLFTYSIFDTTRRPPFLILISIVLTILIYDTFNMILRGQKKFLFLFFFTLSFLTENFVLYYCSLMIASGCFINFFTKQKYMYFGIIIYFIQILIIYFFELERVNSFTEITLVIGMLFLIINIASGLRFPALKFSMLEFYIAQAILFNLLSNRFTSAVGLILTVILVYGLLLVFRRLTIVSWK